MVLPQLHFAEDVINQFNVEGKLKKKVKTADLETLTYFVHMVTYAVSW